jgi:hypothetical protein
MSYRHTPARPPTIGSATPDTAEWSYFNVNGYEYRVRRTGPLCMEVEDGAGGWIKTVSARIGEIACETLARRR